MLLSVLASLIEDIEVLPHSRCCFDFRLVAVSKKEESVMTDKDALSKAASRLLGVVGVEQGDNSTQFGKVRLCDWDDGRRTTRCVGVTSGDACIIGLRR